VFDVTPAPRGSFNAFAERWACDAAKGGIS
jgi:hypothetical protein